MSEYIVDMPSTYNRDGIYYPDERHSGIPIMGEIVRCKDCKHFRIEPWDAVLAAQYGAPPVTCERTGDMDDVEPDGFCAWGERRGDA